MSESCDHSPSLAAALSKISALHGNGEGIAEVVAVGTPAIPALRDILFKENRAGSIRCAAVPRKRSAFSEPLMFSRSSSAGLDAAIPSKGWEMT